MVGNPAGQIAGGPGIRHHKNGCPLHPFVHHRAGYPPAQIEQLNAPVVGSDQRTFRGGQRDKKLALSVFTIDAQRTSQPNGYLRYPNKLLAVALHHGGVESVTGQVRGRRLGELLDVLLPLPDDVWRCIVNRVARNACTDAGIVGGGQRLVAVRRLP